MTPLSPYALSPDARIYVAGHNGLVGSALCRALQRAGHSTLLVRTHRELDLLRQDDVEAFFAAQRPTHVFLAAAKVGGIHANNTCPADFIRDNLLIQTLAVDAAYRHGVKKLLFLGSSCIYPRLCPQPITEDALMTGPLEATNEPYAMAKIAGISLCRAYRRQYGFNAIAAMPTNLYGPGDNFHPEDSHVLPALIRRFDEAVRLELPEVAVWGTGTPRREFLHVDDMAEACLFLMNHYDGDQHVNVGCGKDITIRDLATLVAEATGYTGRITLDPARPNGTPQKRLDTSRLTTLGWTPSIPLSRGIAETVKWYRSKAEAGA